MTRFAGSSFVRLLLIPSAIYLLSFVILTWPALGKFSTHFFCDELDGLQNVWNLWWVRFAVVEQHQGPWYTTWLQFPHGTTLIGHTLNVFNGFVGIPLSAVLSPVQVYNLILSMTFVTDGLFSFWLARHVTGAYWPSVVAGYAFTFSSFHFAHAQGHLQLASLQFIPLFLLLWLRLLERPTVPRAILAGLVLGLLVLCDYYYTLFSMMAAGISLIWSLPALKRAHVVPLVAFGLVAMLCVGPFVGSLLWINARDPMVGAHPADMFSADLPAIVIPGGHWAGHRLTQRYWSRLPGNIEEHSIYVGLTVLGLAVFALTGAQRGIRVRSRGFWLTVAIVFTVLSLGPQLRAFGSPLTGPILPYAWLTEIFPPLKLAGVPARMMVMTILSLSILAAMGLARVSQQQTRIRTIVGVCLVCLIVVETWPRGLTMTAPESPDWVRRLRDSAGSGGVLFDLDVSDTRLLYYQTLHRKPQALGYVSRAPRSVIEKNDRIMQLYRDGEYGPLRHELNFRYIVRYRDGEVVIDDLTNLPTTNPP